ncbi:MAG: hypothetical protein OXH93_13060 [Caldilineaceae bacterium]|nr:hypothetical protein [Caldilineaceae bacterium]
MTDRLFRNADLSDVLAGQEQTMANEVGSLSEERVLNTSPEVLCDYFVEKYRVEPLAIDESGIQVDYSDTQIDVSRRVEYAVFGRSGPIHVTGTRITFFVPFSGDPELFKYRPSTFSLSHLQGVVRGNELMFVYKRTTQEAPNIRSEFKRELQSVQQHLSWIADQVEQFNSTIRTKASQNIGARREKLLQDRGIIEGLGFPLRRRSGVPATYASPEVKRRVVPQLPPVSTTPYRPELTLNMEEYEHILSVISNMVMVMERSPSAFRTMGEEDLRQHFLVQLNGQYDGQATGETFNYEGKTDILIRAEGKNIFIAECKFWTGPAGLSAALDQLLAYTSWRDTKAALLIFNRKATMSTVLRRIPQAVQGHANYKTDLEYDSESGFRYVFSHRDDPDRELTVTVLAFDVPA